MPKHPTLKAKRRRPQIAHPPQPSPPSSFSPPLPFAYFGKCSGLLSDGVGFRGGGVSRIQTRWGCSAGALSLPTPPPRFIVAIIPQCSLTEEDFTGSLIELLSWKSLSFARKGLNYLAPCFLTSASDNIQLPPTPCSQLRLFLQSLIFPQNWHQGERLTLTRVLCSLNGSSFCSGSPQDSLPGSPVCGLGLFWPMG